MTRFGEIAPMSTYYSAGLCFEWCCQTPLLARSGPGAGAAAEDSIGGKDGRRREGTGGDGDHLRSR